MKKIIFLALIIAAAAVQATLMNGFRVFGVKPDLFWIMAMAGALYFDLPSAVVFGVICGLLKDCMSAPAVGAYVVAMPVWSVAVRAFSRRISFDYITVSALFLALLIFVNSAVIRCIPPVSPGPLSFMAFMRVGILESLYTALAFMLVCPWLRRVAASRIW